MRNLKRLLLVSVLALGIMSCQNDDNVAVSNDLTIEGVWRKDSNNYDSQGEYYVGTYEWNIQGDSLTEVFYGRTLNDTISVRVMNVRFDKIVNQVITTSSTGYERFYDVVEISDSVLNIENDNTGSLYFTKY